MRHAFRAFRHPYFRRFFIGQGTSQIGTWLQLIAVSWLVHRLTESTFMLGLAAFALQLPFLLLTPFAGVIVDRLEPRRVLIITNSIAACQATALFALVASGRIEAWQLIVGNLMLGISNAFDAPSRQALLARLVGGRSDLPSAIALNSSMMNGARFIGPMIGGTVIAVLGERWGFALNSLSYFAMLLALASMPRMAPRQGGSQGSLWQRLGTGVRFVYGFLPTRSAMLLLSAVGFCIWPYQSLLPWFADQVYGGSSQTLGVLIGTGGLGAVSALLFLASRPTIRGLLRMIAAAAALSGLALAAFGLCQLLWVGLFLVYLVGAGQMFVAASTNTVLQSIVPDELRARVASLYVMSFIGISPLGAFVGGWVAERIGPPLTLVCGGLLAVVAAGLYARQLPAIRRDIVPLYRELGIVPAAPPPEREAQ